MVWVIGFVLDFIGKTELLVLVEDYCTFAIESAPSFFRVFWFFVIWLIDCFLTSSGKYYMHIEDENHGGQRLRLFCAQTALHDNCMNL